MQSALGVFKVGCLRFLCIRLLQPFKWSKLSSAITLIKVKSKVITLGSIKWDFGNAGGLPKYT